MTTKPIAEVTPNKNILDLFIDGARRGFTIGTTSLLPNVVMAFVIIRILEVTGLLKIIGIVCAPIMALWGLPGEAATVIITSLMSMGGGIGVAVSLYTNAHLDAMQVTMLVPAIYLMGNPVQNIGRCLGISGVNTKHYPAILAICVINALLSIWAMRLILMFF
ncbi:YjiG family protein [Anaerosinus massiliensis]|uniref:YjiG family protein n=1 Tax=Massilibacillus massiliensis TaxID=1806837 RepID=UPI000AAF0DC5|nr:YjiG family protein [Massilibacillus massiliensis]